MAVKAKKGIFELKMYLGFILITTVHAKMTKIVPDFVET
jgi:hypothetical protein